jgi:hypothetical protein
MGELLGLGAPVPEAVLTGALQDEGYARNLLVSRRQPSLLAYLLAHPPRKAVTGGAAPGSNLDLARKASVALWEWARTGFSTVDDATFHKWLDACAGCPHQTERPDGLLHRIAGGRADGKICGICGCPLSRKALLGSEGCPERHPTKPGLTRWDEPVG